MSLLIRGGEIVTPDARYKAEIYVEDQTVTRIGTDLSFRRTPKSSTPPANSSSPASSIRTSISICPSWQRSPKIRTKPGASPLWSVEPPRTSKCAARRAVTTRWRGTVCGSPRPKESSACDYSFHMSVTKFGEQTEGQLREIVADGIASFKIFLAYKNFFGVDDGEMYQTLNLPGSWA